MPPFKRCIWTSFLLIFLLQKTLALDVKIAALFDYNANDTQHMFRYALRSLSGSRTGGEPTDPDDDPDDYDDNDAAAKAAQTIRLTGLSAKIDFGNEFQASRRLCKFLRKGVTAVFGPLSASTSMHCTNICDAKEIPYVDFRWDADTKPPVINMLPHPEAIARLFVDVVQAFQWKGFTILYESAPWLPRAAALLKMYSPKDHTVTVRRINSGLTNNNYRAVLTRVRQSDDVNIVIECSVDTLPELLKQAQQVGLLTDKHHYLITTLDLHTIDLEPYQYSGTNITGIRMVSPQNPLVVQVAQALADRRSRAANSRDEERKQDDEYDQQDIDDDADNNPDDPAAPDREAADDEEEISPGLTAEKMRTQTALMYDAVLLLTEALGQLDGKQIGAKKLNCNSMESWENGHSITNFMRNTIVQGMTGEVKFDNEGQRTQFTLEIVELSSSGLITVGLWNSTTGPSWSRIEVASGAAENNKTFRVITSLGDPYVMMKDSTHQLYGNDQYEGFAIDVIHELSLMLNFNYTILLQADGKYGALNNVTGEWDGMIRELHDYRADLAITDLTITSEREIGADFTMPFMQLGIAILYRKPYKEPPATFTFMSPFSTDVWYYLGAAYLGVSLCLFVLGRISPSEWDNPYPCIEEPTMLVNQFSLRNALWFTIGALLQQGSEIAPKAPSTRVVASIWWFFTLIMVSSYTANLAAFLTVESTKSDITSAESLKDCYDKPQECPVEFGAKLGGSTLNFFKEAKKGTFMNMYKYMEKNSRLLPTSNNEGLKWAMDADRKYAFLMESSSINYIVERNCNMSMVGNWLDQKGYGIAMRKNSTYRSELSEGVLRLQEQGRLMALQTRWWQEKKGGGACMSSGEGDASATELGMPNMSGVFLVLLCGSVFATILGLIDCFLIIYRKSHKYKIPFKEEFINELKFVATCQGNTKTVRHRKSASLDSAVRRSQSADSSRNRSHQGI